MRVAVNKTRAKLRYPNLFLSKKIVNKLVLENSMDIIRHTEKISTELTCFSSTCKGLFPIEIL